LCERLGKSELVARKAVVTCWVSEFAEYLNKKNIKFPIQTSSEFGKRLREWWAYAEKKHKEENPDEDRRDLADHFYMTDGRIKFMHIWAASRLTEQEPANIKYPEYDLWQEFIKKEREMAPKELKSML